VPALHSQKLRFPPKEKKIAGKKEGYSIFGYSKFSVFRPSTHAAQTACNGLAKRARSRFNESGPASVVID
jgi:hypothetical protein